MHTNPAYDVRSIAEGFLCMTRYMIYFFGRSERIVDELRYDGLSEEDVIIAAERIHASRQPFISGFEIWQDTKLVCRKVNLCTPRHTPR